MKKFVSMFLLFIVIIMSCSSCSCSKDDNLIIYRNFYDQDVTTFNYLTTNEYQNVVRIANLIDGLVENDKYGNIVPSIAKSWESKIVDGKQIWTFHLRDDVYWSDYNGNKYALVTANDFVSTFKYSFNYEIKSDNFMVPASLIENGMNYYYGTLIKSYNYLDILNSLENAIKENNKTKEAYYENIKSIFDKCNVSNACTDDFEKVGIKAINDFELEYVLSQPCSYFLSSLTYYSFLPVNEQFLNEVGINNFGTSRKTLLYNGAYILSNYYHSSRIEYTKNKNYWDKDNVFIDKLIFTKSLNYSTHGYMRLAYEAGNLDEFVITEEDKDGWNKYVLGKDKTGSPLAPAGDNTYVIPYTSDYSAYYLLFNQNRTSSKYSTLSAKEIEIANKAMSNTNFRKALFHGIKRGYYFNPESNNTLLSSIVSPNFITYNNTDYTDYLINLYSSKNSIEKDDVNFLYNNDWFFDPNKSTNYLESALNELNIDESELPIKIEYTYYKDNDYIVYRIDMWNKILNGCDTESEDSCDYNKVKIVYNDSLKTSYEFEEAFYNKDFSLSILGLYPDYNDPTAYLSAFSSQGELYEYLNHNDTSVIENYLTSINKYYSYDDLDKRYEECAKLEYYILFEQSLVLPLSMSGIKNQIIVSNVVPFEKMTANYGLSSFKFKWKKIRNVSYSQDDISRLKEEYLKGAN